MQDVGQTMTEKITVNHFKQHCLSHDVGRKHLQKQRYK